MPKTYLEKFEEWMLRTGRMNEHGLPSEPLSPRTASNRVKKVRRILIDLGYILREYEGGNRFRYDFQRGRREGDIRNLGNNDIIQWFNREFATLPDAKARQRKCDYIEAIYKFADFMHFGLRQWSRARVGALKQNIRRPWVPPAWDNKVTILPIKKIDHFIRYLKDQSRMHHMMAYLMRYANMRYAEVINARADLKTGTLIPDFSHNMLIIHGKGRGGLSQRRTTPFLSSNQREFLDFLEWRKNAGIRSEWLFVNQYGGKWADNSGHFNNWLRSKGRDLGFTPDEVKLLTTHKVGRHAYGTDMTIKGLPERLLADNMGIRNPAILTRYQNPTDEIRVQETMKYMNQPPSRETGMPKGLNADGGDERRKRELLDLLITGKISQDTFRAAINLLN